MFVPADEPLGYNFIVSSVAQLVMWTRKGNLKCCCSNVYCFADGIIIYIALQRHPAFPTINEFIHNSIIVLSVAIKGEKYSVVNLMIRVDWGYLDWQCYSGSLSCMSKRLYKSCPNLLPESPNFWGVPRRKTSPSSVTLSPQLPRWKMKCGSQKFHRASDVPHTKLIFLTPSIYTHLEAQFQHSSHKLVVRVRTFLKSGSDLHSLLGSVRRNVIPANAARASISDHNFYSHYSKIWSEIQTDVTSLNCHHDYCFFTSFAVGLWRKNFCLAKNIKSIENYP